MELQLDTSHAKTITVRLVANQAIIAEVSANNTFGSQAILPLIREVVHKADSNSNAIHAITVATTGTSFTGLRVGAAVANALGYSLGIPVNGCKIPKQLVVPTYYV